MKILSVLKSLYALFSHCFDLPYLNNQVGALKFYLGTPSLNITSANSPVYASQSYRTRKFMIQNQVIDKQTTGGVPHTFTDPFSALALVLKNIQVTLGSNVIQNLSGQMLHYYNFVNSGKSTYMENTLPLSTNTTQTFITVLDSTLTKSPRPVDSIYDFSTGLSIQFTQSGADSDVCSNTGYTIVSATLAVSQIWDQMPRIPAGWRSATKWLNTYAKSLTASISLQDQVISPPAGNRIGKILILAGTGSQSKVIPAAEVANTAALTGIQVDVTGFPLLPTSYPARLLRAYHNHVGNPITYGNTESIQYSNVEAILTGPKGLYVIYSQSPRDTSVQLTNYIPVPSNPTNRVVMDASSLSTFAEILVESYAGQPSPYFAKPGK